MKNRITQLFKDKPKNILSIFFSAGYPELHNTIEIIKYLELAKVDLIEVGIPFSDPLADGPTIQDSSQVALNNGATLTHILNDLAKIRDNTVIPIVIMGYLNPILQYGVEEFLKKCEEIGIDGIIIPDLPMDYYNLHFKESMAKKSLSYIALISQQTPIERIQLIDQHATGFIYMVSSNGITGSNIDLQANEQYYKTATKVCKNNPTLIGFGVKDKQSYKQACNHSSGAIIGTAFIDHLRKNGVSQQSITNFISQIR
ncbi:tryptophan synthase subunit alpha [Myroides sp. LJL110]